MIRTSEPKRGNPIFRSALGIALALGVVAGGATVSSPAIAAKKDKAPKLDLSPDFYKAIVKANDAVQKKDIEAARTALAEAEPLIKTNDDRYQYFSIVLNAGITAGDHSMQVKGLRGMLDTGMVPAEQVGQFSIVAADASLKEKDYESAIRYARNAEATGFKPEQVYPVLAQAIWGKAGNANATSEPVRSQILEGLNTFKKGIDALKASGQEVPSQWYEVGVQKAAIANLPQLKDWANWAFVADPSGQNLRTVLRIFQQENSSMSNRENLDLLRLMHWSGGLALAPDYIEYAEMAFKSGIYGEVKATIDDGRKKGILKSSEGGEMYTNSTDRISADKASLGSAVSDANKSATGKIAAAAADAYLGYDDYDKAVELYNLALQKGSVDPNEINTRIGITLAKKGDAAGALQAFSKVQGGVRGGIAKFWSEYLTRNSSAPATAAATQ